MSKICRLSYFQVSILSATWKGWLSSWWCCGLAHGEFGTFPFLVSVCGVQHLPKCCLAERLECWNCLGWSTCLLLPFPTHCLSCSSGLFILRAFMLFGWWKLALLHTRGTGRELQWESLDRGSSKVRLAPPSKLSWSQVTVCSLFVPHSSSGSIHLVFFWLLCNCQRCFFSHQPLMLLVRQTVPVRRCYWWYW